MNFLQESEAFFLNNKVIKFLFYNSSGSGFQVELERNNLKSQGPVKSSFQLIAL